MDITTIDNIKKLGKKDENMKITLIGRPSRELTYLAKQLYKDQYLQKVITFRYLDVNDSRETIKLFFRLKKGNEINKLTNAVFINLCFEFIIKKTIASVSKTEFHRICPSYVR